MPSSVNKSLLYLFFFSIHLDRVIGSRRNQTVSFSNAVYLKNKIRSQLYDSTYWFLNGDAHSKKNMAYFLEIG